MSYQAIVTRIHTRPLPGSDRIQLGTCGQYQVIVGIDVQDGELGVFFEGGGQLSEEFCRVNDLIRRKDENGNPAGGMFEPSRKVRSIKLRGARSEGYWCPLSYFDYCGELKSYFFEGLQFSEVNGHQICCRYETAATQRAKGRYGSQKQNLMFAKHVDTGHFKREALTIPQDSFIVITEKLHGTSQRVGYVLDNVPINRSWLMDKIAKVLGWPSHTQQWRTLVGTRNVILKNAYDVREGDFHGGDGYRYAAVKNVQLHPGEVLYGEVVGYDNGRPLMGSQNIDKIKDKTLKGNFSGPQVFDYGCLPGQAKFYVYRITQVDIEGHVTELSWFALVKRCKELGVNHVPVLWKGYNVDPAELNSIAQELTEYSEGQPKPSVLDPEHIREGVVVRAESEHGVKWLKNKGYTFGILEGYLKEDETFVDTEESS